MQDGARAHTEEDEEEVEHVFLSKIIIYISLPYHINFRINFRIIKKIVHDTNKQYIYSSFLCDYNSHGKYPTSTTKKVKLTLEMLKGHP